MNAPTSAQDFLQFNHADARKLFERLDHIHLVAILPDTKNIVGKYFGSDVDAALAWAANVNGNGWGVYWTLNYVGPSVGAKPSKDDIQAARGAHCDLDPPKDGRTWEKGEKIGALADHALPPSLVIDSGNGVQPVWLLDEPAREWLQIEAANIGIRDTFGGDDCHNIDRLLRVPGSVNYPNRAKRLRGCVPCMATWVLEDTGKRYRPDDLTAAFRASHRTDQRAPANDSDRVPTQTGALIAAIRRGDNWHNNMLRLTAHLVAKGRTTVEILAMADCLTLAGYTVDDTRADIILLGHPNKREDEYSGSTAWNNAVRSRLFLDHDEDTDTRTLSLPKANYSQKGDVVRFVWQDWAFVTEDELTPERRDQRRQTEQAAGDNLLFLSCLAERLKQQRAVSEKRGPNFAPVVFAAMPESKGIGKTRLESAMDRLFRIEKIARAELWKGPDRKPVFGLRETAGNGAVNTMRETRETVRETAEILAGNAPNTLSIPKGITGAAYGPAAPDTEGADT